MRTLQPKLKKLQDKFKNDKQKLAQAQLSLYKQEGVNPMSGCLPQLLQLVVLIFFYQAFNLVSSFSIGNIGWEQLNSYLLPGLKVGENFSFNLAFLGATMTQTPAAIFGNGMGLAMVLPLVLLVGSGLMQFLSAKLLAPGSADKKVDESAYTKATEDKEDDMMAAMRTQSTYFMPLMTIVIGWNFSLGILMYWFVNSGIMLLQQLAASKLMNREVSEKGKLLAS